MAAQLALDLYTMPTEEDLDTWETAAFVLEEMPPDTLPPAGVCEWCGDDTVQEDHGLDLDYWPDGHVTVNWTPCCQTTRDAVEHYGWELVYGISLEQDLARVLGIEVPRGVDVDYLDSLVIFHLEARVLEKHERDEAFAQIDEHHLHHDAPIQWKFGLVCYNGAVRVGVAIVERPKSRLLCAKEPKTLEVTRVCTWGDPRLREHASSKLYGLACREAKKRGATKVISYTLESEAGTSLKAAGFKPVKKTKGGKWSRKMRPRADKAPTCKKMRWERVL